jgi:hypothetical protein
MLKGSRSFVRSPMPIVARYPTPINEIERSKRDRKIDHAQDQPVQHLKFSLFVALNTLSLFHKERTTIYRVRLSAHRLFYARRIERGISKSDDQSDDKRPSPRDADSDFAESVIGKVWGRSNSRWLWFGLVACLSTICSLPGLRSATRSTIRP